MPAIAETPDFLPGSAQAQVAVAMALAATDYTIFTLPTLANGCRARVTKILGWNGAGANAQWTVGYTTALGVFTQVYPILLALAGVENVWRQDELPQFTFDSALGAAIIFRTNLAVAGQQAMVEVVYW